MYLIQTERTYRRIKEDFASFNTVGLGEHLRLFELNGSGRYVNANVADLDDL
jgi:hypothetical protein